ERPRPPDLDEQPLLLATLCAFPDRVARRRAPRSSDVVFAGGGSARLAETSVVREAELLVVLEAEERRRAVVARLARAIEPEWLLALSPDRIADRREVRFAPAAERVELITALDYAGLALEESRRPAAGDPDATRVLAAAALAAGPAA